jgi:hypothetical protein
MIYRPQVVLETKISSNTLTLQVSEKCKNLIIHIQGPANLKGNDEVPEASSQIGTAETSPEKNLCALIIQMHLKRIDFRPIELSSNSMRHFVRSWSPMIFHSLFAYNINGFFPLGVHAQR